jgi:ABC-2 type transport system ATP-binding protein
VCILKKGEVVLSGSLGDLLAAKRRRKEIALSGVSERLRLALAPLATAARATGDALVLEVEGDAEVRAVVEQAFAEGARLQSVTPKRESLEDLFVREAF